MEPTQTPSRGVHQALGLRIGAELPIGSAALQQTEGMLDDAELRHLDSLVAALVESGNALCDSGFVPSPSGPECRFRDPLDLTVVRRFVEADRGRLSYDATTDSVHCRHCWGALIGGSA